MKYFGGCDSGSTYTKCVIIDENGKTPIEVAPGKYKITVTQVPEGYEVTVGETAEITVPENGEARHEAKILPKSGGLKVKVVEEGTNREVPNATVEIDSAFRFSFRALEMLQVIRIRVVSLLILQQALHLVITRLQ